MKSSREILNEQLARYEKQLGGIKSYITELKDMTAKHGTEREYFAEDLAEAEHNVMYYEGEIARIKKEVGESPRARSTPAATGAILPQTAKQGLGSFIFSSIGFVAGVLLGARLKSRRSSQDR